ncbi:MAG: serine hydrolase domain-containing protein [Actinomycetota bacterium]
MDRFPLRPAILALALGWAFPAGAAELDRLAAAVAGRFEFPGAILLVSTPEGSETASFGVANLATGAPVTADTRFHVASVGKVVTAVAALQLVEAGTLSLDTPVRPFVDNSQAPRLPNIETATLGRLLSHTSGLPDCLRNGSFSLPEHPSIRWTASDALRFGHCRPPTAPGAYAYSNTNYILLGHILELRDGADLATVLDRRVLAPLGMTSSSGAVSPADPLLAHGYRRADDKGRRQDASLLAWSSALGDAPLTTTAADLERLFASLFRPGGQHLLGPALLADMAVERGHDDDEGYGLGLQRVVGDAGLRLGHSGRFAGFAAEAWYYPERDRIVILLANGDEHTSDDPMDMIEAALFPIALCRTDDRSARIGENAADRPQGGTSSDACHGRDG